MVSSIAKEIEKDVVKLVHPGRHVEILKEPITASEVMEKNPRHCITRPDFFENPWIVVRPESLLKRGRVYYLVPNHTIHDLMMKASGRYNKPPALPSMPSNHHYSRTHRTVSRDAASSPTTSCAGLTPKHRAKSRAFTSCTGGGACSPVQPVGCAPRRLKKRYSQVESCPEVVDRYRFYAYQESESQCLEETIMEKRAWQACYDQSSSFDYTSEDERIVVVRVDGNSSARSGDLKSCLRKPDSVRKSLSLKVTFNLPDIIKPKKQS